MKQREHRYAVTIEWTGNTGSGTSNYRAYERAHEIRTADGSKPLIPGSADPAFRGDSKRWNPEELLVASASACHKLWYLHLCSDAGIVVTGYVDHAEGVMVEGGGGSGRFKRIVLKPQVRLADEAHREKADALHHKAHEMCFIANSVNCRIDIEPALTSEGANAAARASSDQS